MEKEGFYAKIPKKKAELPAVIVLVIVMLIGFAFHYDFFWLEGWIYLGRYCSPSTDVVISMEIGRILC